MVQNQKNAFGQKQQKAKKIDNEIKTHEENQMDIESMKKVKKQQRIIEEDDEEEQQIQIEDLKSNKLQNYDIIADTLNQLMFQNKINQKNAFDFPFPNIQELASFKSKLLYLQQQDPSSSDSWKLFSSTLESGAKIYGYRVDSVHQETFKILGGMKRGQKDEEMIDEKNNENEQEIEEECEEKKIIAKKIAIHKSNDGQNTLEKVISNLNIQKYDMDFEIDPLFKKTSAKFDESGAKGLLLNNLNISKDLEIKLDSESKSTPCDVDVQIHQLSREKLRRIPLQTILEKNQICPQLLQFIEETVSIAKLHDLQQFGNFNDKKKNVQEMSYQEYSQNIDDHVMADLNQICDDDDNRIDIEQVQNNIQDQQRLINENRLYNGLQESSKIQNEIQQIRIQQNNQQNNQIYQQNYEQIEEEIQNDQNEDIEIQNNQNNEQQQIIEEEYEDDIENDCEIKIESQININSIQEHIQNIGYKKKLEIKSDIFDIDKQKKEEKFKKMKLQPDDILFDIDVDENCNAIFQKDVEKLEKDTKKIKQLLIKNPEYQITLQRFQNLFFRNNIEQHRNNNYIQQQDDDNDDNIQQNSQLSEEDYIQNEQNEDLMINDENQEILVEKDLNLDLINNKKLNKKDVIQNNSMKMTIKQFKEKIWKYMSDSKLPAKIDKQNNIEFKFSQIYNNIPTIMNNNNSAKVSIQSIFVSILHLANEKSLNLQNQNRLDFTITQD